MRALIIDDEEGVRTTLAENLRAQCFAVDTASDGTEGSYMARTGTYDIIILDNMLPEKSGVTICQEVRRTGHATPILVLSVLSDTWRKIDLLNGGADDYMIKPFSFEELMARIRALMRRPSQIEGDTLTLDDLVLDTKRQDGSARRERHLSDAQGIRPARIPDAEPRKRAFPRDDHGACMGHDERPILEHNRIPYTLAPQEDRCES